MLIPASAVARDQIRIVGSSTVFPYTQAAAEEFSNRTGDAAPVVEATGTGGGMKIFCQGLGIEYPDITGASRAMKPSERALCVKNGVTDISEALIGYDGLSVAVSRQGTVLDLTKAQLFLALAAELRDPSGKWIANPNRTWRDVDATLPNLKIQVFGPPPTSGTRDAFVELAMHKGCKQLYGKLPKTEVHHQCSRMRQDGPFIEAGENDNLIVQRLNADTTAYGIFGYSFLFENRDTLRAIKVKGVVPSMASIADGSYGISRPLYFYAKNAHRGVIAGMQTFLEEYLSDAAMGKGGYLLERGLVPLATDKRLQIRDAVVGANPVKVSGDLLPTSIAWLGWIVLALLITLPVAGFLGGRSRAAAISDNMHSLAIHHGAYVALWTSVPTLAVLLFWLALQTPALDAMILASLPDAFLAGKTETAPSLIVAQIESVAAGRFFTEPTAEIRAAADRLIEWRAIADKGLVAAIAIVSLIGLLLARARVAPDFRARYGIERMLDALMLLCAVVAVFSTLGIVLSLVFESARFFEHVSIADFLFGLKWEPQIAMRADQVAGHGAFGAVPVFLGTLLIAGIAMIVATPIGLLSAIYFAEFASRRMRAFAKPAIEILAGIPTVVYGFFAVLVVAPALREFGLKIGLDVEANSALAAGAVMGIMIIPFISSLADDAITAVPGTLKDGSLALGATKSETITKVLLPAALPGIAGGLLLAVSRAIGETMIVVMAAGMIARMTANPLDSVTTVTVQIVSLLTGDTEFDSPKTLAAFALGLVLFLATLALNIVALHIVRKYREQYD